MRVRPVGIVGFGCALAVAAAGCAGASDTQASLPSTYQLAPQTVRPDETALKLPPALDGLTQFTVIGYTSVASLVGSHAEMQSVQGKFVRLRLVVVNTDRSTTELNTDKNLLLTATGATYAPDNQAMSIKRQPRTLELGANVRVEFDLYYDVPADTKPTGLRLFGGVSLADPTDEQGVEIQLGLPGS
jgi:hypothetical protein